MNIVNLAKVTTCSHYCGRVTSFNARQHGLFMDLGNPFFVKPGRTREQAIREYEHWVRNRPELVARIRSLPATAVLGCWCQPMPCHLDVIVKLWKELHA